MYVFAVLWLPEKEKLAHIKKELKKVCFCSIVMAREGKNGPRKMKEKCENFKFRSAGCSLWKTGGPLLKL
jgi:hypothetical protein